jgi:hypothetical protein
VLAADRRPDPPLARFGQRHPLLGGIVAAVVTTGIFVVLGSALALFQDARLTIVLSAVFGAITGLGMGTLWSYRRRTGTTHDSDGTGSCGISRPLKDNCTII